MARHRTLGPALLGFLLLVVPLAQPQAAAESEDWAANIRELIERLHRVSLDVEAAYRVDELYFRRDAIRIELSHGTLVFLRPTENAVTGALFVGEGRVLVMPPMQSERQQLARFTGSPILAESFSSAYLRFTDSTAAELRANIAAGRGSPTEADEFIQQWDGVVQTLNPSYSVRVLTDLISLNPRPYFAAALSNRRLGRFDVVLDERQDEEVLVGQTRWRNDRLYYDVWCSFPREGREPQPKPATWQPISYRIQTTIAHNHSLEGNTEVRFRARVPNERVVLFELSRYLQVEEVTDEDGTRLPFFQNESVTAEQLRILGTDYFVVILPPRARGDTHYTLRFRYQGQVITDIGSGVLYVGARGIWYPSLHSPWPAPFEMEFRYPRALALVASGRRLAESQEGPWRVSRWASEVPIPLAGFNLGAYESHERTYQGIPVRVYANQQLEPALALPFTPPPVVLPTDDERSPGRLQETPPVPRRNIPELMLPLPSILPRPSALIEEVGEEVGSALDFFVERFGPFPYPRLNVSQIPGRIGQGYPGLLYLSTFTFLQGRDLARLGLSERTREHFSGLIPAHETAHQWWGTRVRVPSYRDQWLIEALATYSSLLYLESKSGGEQLLRQWLERYRDDLLAHGPTAQPWEAAGPLALGRRLSASLSPGTYERVIYPKGAWILHMLRYLLSDKAFFELLRTIADEYGDKPFGAAALQALAEARISPQANLDRTGSLDWFFDQWVNNTGIPHYRMQTRVEQRPQHGFRVSGRIQTRGVSDLFTMPVPVYARVGRELHLLGRVLVSGPETSFTFVTPTRPNRILLDPYQTVLCVIEE